MEKTNNFVLYCNESMSQGYIFFHLTFLLYQATFVIADHTYTHTHTHTHTHWHTDTHPHTQDTLTHTQTHIINTHTHTLTQWHTPSHTEWHTHKTHTHTHTHTHEEWRQNCRPLQSATALWRIRPVVMIRVARFGLFYDKNKTNLFFFQKKDWVCLGGCGCACVCVCQCVFCVSLFAYLGVSVCVCVSFFYESIHTTLHSGILLKPS